ncbi:hypothetical protein C8J57DRAFT_1004841, partial [Mycena rebaudengoi]
FPQELTDKIIDFAHSDPVAWGKPMKTCGLISKSWGPRTRFHLFSSICIDADNLGGLVDIVDSSPCSILAFIRYLRLRYVGRAFNAAELARI